MSQADDKNICIGFNPLAPIGEIAAQLHAERLRIVNADLIKALDIIRSVATAAIAKADASR